MVATEKIVLTAQSDWTYNIFFVGLLSQSGHPLFRYFIVLSHRVYAYVMAFTIWEFGLYLTPFVSIQIFIAFMTGQAFPDV